MANIKKINFETWEKRFCPNFDSEIHVVETYGEDLDKVRNTDILLIWTIVDGDDDNFYISQGFRIVDRFNYIIAEIPRVEGELFHDIKY